MHRQVQVEWKQAGPCIVQADKEAHSLKPAAQCTGSQRKCTGSQRKAKEQSKLWYWATRDFRYTNLASISMQQQQQHVRVMQEQHVSHLISVRSCCELLQEARQMGDALLRLMMPQHKTAARRNANPEKKVLIERNDSQSLHQNPTTDGNREHI